jgi:hypothetical protein
MSQQNLPDEVESPNTLLQDLLAAAVVDDPAIIPDDERNRRPRANAPLMAQLLANVDAAEIAATLIADALHSSA